MDAEEVYECPNCGLYFADLELGMNHSCAELPVQLKDSGGGDEKVGDDDGGDGDAETKDNGTGSVWSRQATMLLLQLYRQHLHLFHSPRHRKMDVWARISRAMTAQGHHYTGLTCNAKYKGMLQRYRIILRAKKHPVAGRQPWGYFDLMHNIQEQHKTEEMKVQQQCVKVFFKEEVPSPVQDSGDGNGDGGDGGGDVDDGVNGDGAATGNDEAQSQVQEDGGVGGNDGGGQSRRNGPAVVWGRQAVLLLLQLYRKHQHLFRLPGQKKMDVWARISQAMITRGHHYSGDTCDGKFRSLLQRYRIIRSSIKAKGLNHPTWPYFDLMHELMRNQVTTEPQHAIIQSSPDSKTPAEHPDSHKRPHPVPEPGTPSASSSCQSEEEEGPSFPSQNVAGNQKRRRLKEEPPPWFKDFLMEQRMEVARLRKLQEEAVEVAKERNAILKTFTEALLKK